MGLYTYRYNPVYRLFLIEFKAHPTKMHTLQLDHAIKLINQLNESTTGFEIIFHESCWKIIVVPKNFIPKEFNFPNFVSPLTGISYPGFDNDFNEYERADLYLTTQLSHLSLYFLGKVLSVTA